MSIVTELKNRFGKKNLEADNLVVENRALDSKSQYAAASVAQNPALVDVLQRYWLRRSSDKSKVNGSIRKKDEEVAGYILEQSGIELGTYAFGDVIVMPEDIQPNSLPSDYFPFVYVRYQRSQPYRILQNPLYRVWLNAQGELQRKLIRPGSLVPASEFEQLAQEKYELEM